MRYEFTKWPSDKNIRSGSDVESLEAEFAALGRDEHFQLWMFKSDGEIACVMANTSLAWLNIFPTDGNDVIVIDVDLKESAESAVFMYLENGQLDEVTRINCINRQLGISAALHYFRTGLGASFVTWLPYDLPPAAS